MLESFDNPDAPFVPAGGGRVNVGYDGSVLAVAALDWAAREATVRSALLRIITASTPSPGTDFYDVGHARRQNLDAAADVIAGSYPNLRIERLTTVLDPGDALIDGVAHNDLVVVGASTGGAARRVMFGSVARTVARRSPCPVVIVHEPHHATAVDTVVVGVDGSTAASAAIRWACSESHLHGASVEVVHAQDTGSDAGAQEIVAAAMDQCRGLTPNLVQGRVAPGSAAEVLVDATSRANLVVVGSRGRGRFTSAVLGSVAVAVAAGGQCPVAVTHPVESGRGVDGSDR